MDRSIQVKERRRPTRCKEKTIECRNAEAEDGPFIPPFECLTRLVRILLNTFSLFGRFGSACSSMVQ